MKGNLTTNEGMYERNSVFPFHFGILIEWEGKRLRVKNQFNELIITII